MICEGPYGPSGENATPDQVGVFTIQPVSVEHVRGCIEYYSCEIAIAFAIEFIRYGTTGCARTLDHHLHRFSAWRPHAEVGTARWLSFRADGQAPDHPWLISMRKFSSSFGREITRAAAHLNTISS